jgi:hypothetical protein
LFEPRPPEPPVTIWDVGGPSGKAPSGGPRIVIHALDIGPDDLEAQLPIHGQLLRSLPGPDGGDYTLAQLSTPISWSKDGSARAIRYLIVAPHLVGDRIRCGEKSLGIKIAYVTDDSLASELKLDFAKAEYQAIGFASVEYAIRTSWIQRLLKSVLPSAWARDMEAASRSWKILCPCGQERSVWDVGGVRWKAWGNPRRLMRCSRCGKLTWHTVYRTPSIPADSDLP